MSWLEITLVVESELGEPIAELLGRYTESGVVLEQEHPEDPHPKITVRAYLPMDEQVEHRRQSIEEGLWHLSQISPLPDPVYRNIKQQDWSQAWRKHYHPITIGEQLLVLPAWVDPPTTDRKIILIEPGMAFGTGTHPTTRMCLLAIDEYCQSGDFVIDVGCGSGILSIAALHSGAKRVLACDIDAESIEAAQQNLALNRLSGQVQLIQGSLKEVLPLCPSRGVPLVLANILAPIIVDLLNAGLHRLVAPQGLLILSGILDDQLEDILGKTSGLGFQQVSIYEENDWRAVALSKTKEPLS